MRRVIAIAIFSLLALGTASCSLLTEFDEGLIDDDAGDTAGLYSLRDNLISPVAVTVVSNLGVIDLSLTAPLPDVEDDVLKGLLTDGTIDLNVENIDTAVNYDLFGSGTLVESTPNVEGQFSVEVNATRDALTIRFFNSFDGKVIQPDSDYAATLKVLSNDHFITDTIPLDVTVTAG